MKNTKFVEINLLGKTFPRNKEYKEGPPKNGSIPLVNKHNLGPT